MTKSNRTSFTTHFLTAVGIATALYFGVDLYAGDSSDPEFQAGRVYDNDVSPQLPSTQADSVTNNATNAQQIIEGSSSVKTLTPEEEVISDSEREIALRYAIESHRHAQGVKVLSFKCENDICTLEFIDYTDGRDWAFINRDLQKHPLFPENQSGSHDGEPRPDGNMQYTFRWGKHPVAEPSEAQKKRWVEIRAKAPKRVSLDEAFRYFKDQPDDGVWSLETKSKLESFIAEHQYGSYANLKHLECRGRSCAIVIDASTEDGRFYLDLLKRDLNKHFYSTFPAGRTGPLEDLSLLPGHTSITIMSDTGFSDRIRTSLDAIESTDTD